jgi:hypothetical protein
MQDFHGNFGDDKEKMYVRSTQNLLEHPEMVVLLDETGSNKPNS